MSKLLNGATQLQLMIGFILEGLIMVHSFSISYTNVGDDVTVTCPSDKVFSWRFLKTDEILAFCNGKIKINMNTNISERLNISSNCSLQIFQFKKEDVGEYQCSHPNVSVNGKTRHITNVQLRKIKIEGVDYSKVIQAPEGKTVTLICIFKGGKQSETLHWTSGDELLKSGRPPTLKYAFLSKSTDNKKYYTCGSNNSDDKPLQSRIQLFLLHKPNVLIRIHIKSVQFTQQKSIKVKERDKLELLCQLSNESAGSLTWSHNILMLSNSMNNKLIFENVERKITGTFVCTAVNVAGKDSDSVNVLVEYDPLVLDTNEVFSTRYKPRNLKCEVSGEPNIFKFNKWRHVVNGHPVRFLDGNNDGTLTLPFDNTSDIQYDDSGLYICNVSNGIQNKNGQLWQTGTVNVTIKNKPVLAKPHKKVYIGHNSSTTTVAVYLLSSSALSSANWFKEGNNFVQTTPCIASTVNTNFHGTLVDVSGYVCSLSITETEKRNFQNYSVTVSNNCCSNTFNFSIKSAREPGKPNVLRFTSSTNSINVLLEPGSDDGRHQEFIIEYRKQQRKKWKRLLVKNVGTSELICYIPSLNPSTEYEFRIFARNSIGNSSSTDTYKVWTKDEKKYKGYTIAIIIVTTVVTVCLIIICWRHRKSNSFRCIVYLIFYYFYTTSKSISLSLSL